MGGIRQGLISLVLKAKAPRMAKGAGSDFQSTEPETGTEGKIEGGKGGKLNAGKQGARLMGQQTLNGGNKWVQRIASRREVDESYQPKRKRE